MEVLPGATVTTLEDEGDGVGRPIVGEGVAMGVGCGPGVAVEGGSCVGCGGFVGSGGCVGCGGMVGEGRSGGVGVGTV